MPFLRSGTISELFWRKSSKSPESDIKSEFLRPENPKFDPFRANFQHLARPKSGGRKSSTDFRASEIPVFPEKQARLDILVFGRILGSNMFIQLQHAQNGRFHYFRPLLFSPNESVVSSGGVRADFHLAISRYSV